jgi:hypothetical protein
MGQPEQFRAEALGLERAHGTCQLRLSGVSLARDPQLCVAQASDRAQSAAGRDRAQRPDRRDGELAKG